MAGESEPGLTPDADEETACARHPNVATGLMCGRCGTPICPRCLVQTPVGARCPTCANVRRLPTVDVKPIFLLRGLGAAVGSGAAAGAVWGFLVGGVFGFFLFFVAMGVGYAVGESVSVATNRKRSTTLQGCAVLGVVLAYLVRNAVIGAPLLPANDIWGYMAVVIAAVVAAGRLKA